MALLQKKPVLNEIIEKRFLAPSIISFNIYAPIVAEKALPGQFILIRSDDCAERIPMTIVDYDRIKGVIKIIIQVVGVSTRKMANLEPGDQFMDVVGPLGLASEIENYGTVVCVGGGLGVAPIFPITRALKEIGNNVISIIGVRSRKFLFYEDEMGSVSDKLLVTTDDGTYGQQGFVTDEIQRLIEGGQKVDRVVAIGPIQMMKYVCRVTKPHGIKTIVSLNPLMVDGTGMCGGCRVTIGDEIKFACVDGPEFDGHLVDFDEMISRSVIYAREEHRAMWSHDCRLSLKAKAMEKKSKKKRQKKPREPMPRQNPKARVKNFNEVALGYTEEQAVREAQRCIQCKKPICIDGCPVEVDIPAFIALMQKGEFLGAIRKIKEKNSLPAICGRVCPQEDQCEKNCILGKKGDAIAIGRLERFCADYEFNHGEIRAPSLTQSTGKKVAVIGAGPAGLTVAGDLAHLGHKATIFEALHSPGGVLVYGIPEFRLPKRIVQLETDYVRKLGVGIVTSFVAGQSCGIDELMEKKGYDAVFIGTGAGLPYFMKIPGENLKGVYSANEFLTRTNLMKAYRFPEYDTPIHINKRVAVVGGGNVAMDSARSALRLGAEEVYNIYRRSREEMPARKEEVENADEEGVRMVFLTNPKRILSNRNGWVKGIECIRMELGPPDASGRRRPTPIPGSDHILDVDAVILAIGQGANPLLIKSTPDIKLNKWGYIVADDATGRTSKKGVFAGGDIVTGAATVILAMGAGRSAAKSIHQYLNDGIW